MTPPNTSPWPAVRGLALHSFMRLAIAFRDYIVTTLHSLHGTGGLGGETLTSLRVPSCLSPKVSSYFL